MGRSSRFDGYDSTYSFRPGGGWVGGGSAKELAPGRRASGEEVQGTLEKRNRREVRDAMEW
jgi:hypothetical protein